MARLQQGAPVGRRGGCQPLLLESRQQKAVDGGPGPGRVADGRDGHGLDRLEGPEPPLRVGKAGAGRSRPRSPVSPPWSPAREAPARPSASGPRSRDPSASPWAASSARARSGWPAMRGLPRDRRRSRRRRCRRPSRTARPRSQSQAPLGPAAVAVARPALLDQKRTHAFLEELGVGATTVPSLPPGPRPAQQEKRASMAIPSTARGRRRRSPVPNDNDRPENR